MSILCPTKSGSPHRLERHSWSGLRENHGQRGRRLPLAAPRHLLWAEVTPKGNPTLWTTRWGHYTFLFLLSFFSGRLGFEPSNFYNNAKLCDFTRCTIKVFSSCLLMVVLFLCSFESNIQDPLKATCQLKKPFKGPRWRQWSCW